jgi:citrate synthase
MSYSGFPSDFILPLSMMSRTQGMMAHWREAMSKLWNYSTYTVSLLTINRPSSKYLETIATLYRRAEQSYAHFGVNAARMNLANGVHDDATG